MKPSPPLAEDAGTGGRFTPADHRFFIHYLRWRLAKDPLVTREVLYDELAEQVCSNSAARQCILTATSVARHRRTTRTRGGGTGTTTRSCPTRSSSRLGNARRYRALRSARTSPSSILLPAKAPQNRQAKTAAMRSGNKTRARMLDLAPSAHPCGGPARRGASGHSLRMRTYGRWPGTCSIRSGRCPVPSAAGRNLRSDQRYAAWTPRSPGRAAPHGVCRRRWVRSVLTVLLAHAAWGQTLVRGLVRDREVGRLQAE